MMKKGVLFLILLLNTCTFGFASDFILYEDWIKNYFFDNKLELEKFEDLKFTQIISGMHKRAGGYEYNYYEGAKDTCKNVNMTLPSPELKDTLRRYFEYHLALPRKYSINIWLNDGSYLEYFNQGKENMTALVVPNGDSTNIRQNINVVCVAPIKNNERCIDCYESAETIVHIDKTNDKKKIQATRTNLTKIFNIMKDENMISKIPYLQIEKKNEEYSIIVNNISPADFRIFKKVNKEYSFNFYIWTENKN